jgi:hypothetical protein
MQAKTHPLKRSNAHVWSPHVLSSNVYSYSSEATRPRAGVACIGSQAICPVAFGGDVTLKSSGRDTVCISVS